MSIIISINAADDPAGFNNASWGSSPEDVRGTTGANNWQIDNKTTALFPQESGIKVFISQEQIAQYSASVKYYFWKDQFFQATVKFDLNDLKNYDFNYNVYRSVNEYYTFVRSRSLIFVHDIYDLLGKKYGKKEPVFKGLDPRFLFIKLDAYLKQERWNLRYNPYDYYQRIVSAAYARWDFPKTRAIFSINLSAPDKRFDYQLSLTSLDLEKTVKASIDIIRMKGL